jgi:hypothetical protein
MKQEFLLELNPKLLGDKILLPQSALNEVLREFGGKWLDSGPLVFQISRQTHKAYGVVLEFTEETPRKTVQVGEFLAAQLSFNQAAPSAAAAPQNAAVILENVILEKATFASLAPLTANYLNISDMRSLLESHLRHRYTTLVQGSQLSVDFGRNQIVKFVIKKLFPNPVCLVVDTDLEVEIQPEDESLALQALQERATMKAAEIQWKDGNYNFALVKRSELERFQIPLPTGVFAFDLEVEVQEGDCNIFVSDTNENPSILDHRFYSLEQGARTLSIQLDPAENQSPFLYIAIESYPIGSVVVYSMILKGSKDSSSITPAKSSSSPQATDPTMELCKNCHNMIPLRSIQMHTAFCLRNNIFCSPCSRVFLKADFENHWHCEQCPKFGPISEKAKHMSLLHSSLRCSCGESLVPPQVSKHKQFDCMDRFIICRFCHLLVKAGPFSRTAKDLILGCTPGLTEHESVCGSRTITCIKCNKSIQLKDISIHAQTHELQKQQQPLPFDLCRNVICGNAQNSSFINNLKLCQSCYRPFYSPTYDPTNQKMAQKFVQVYHQQLTKGCSTDHCINPVSYFANN